MGRRQDKLIAVSLSKLDSQNESPHPPVKRLVKPRLNLHSMRRVRYSKPGKTSTPDSSKICNRVDTKYQVSTFLSPYMPVFFVLFCFYYNLGMFLKPIIILSLQKVLIVCLRRALRQWEPLWNRLSFYGFNSVFGMLSVLSLFSRCHDVLLSHPVLSERILKERNVFLLYSHEHRAVTAETCSCSV